MIRSPNSELARRINITQSMLRKYSITEEVVAELIRQYGVSRRQAYRYIQEAQKTKGKLPIPEQKIVFTIKVPKSLVFRIRQFAKSTGKSLSTIVTQALDAFLKRKGYG